MRASRVLALLAVLAALPVAAQPFPQVTPVLPTDIINQGASYVVFTEPGAPTVDVFVVQQAGRTGIFRIAEGTTLTELLVLAGGPSGQSAETSQFVRTAFVRVLRNDGSGLRNVIYEASPEEMLREPGRHPQIITGDLIETEVVVEEVRRVTFLRVIETASRIGSFITLIIVLTNRF